MQTLTSILKTCLTVSAIVCFLSSAAAQNATNVLQGRVVTPNGQQPTNPVKVRLTFNGRLIYETFSDLSGRFTFPGLQPGNYQLTAEGDGRTFETTSVRAEVSVFGRAGQTITQDITLRPMVLKGVITQPGVINAFRQDVPPNARSAFEQGMKLADAGQPDQAINKMREAVSAFPKYFDAHLQLGNLFLKTGRTADAIAELDLAREINPNDERAYQSFGILLMGQKNYPVAVAVFGEAERLNPTNPMNALMRGIALIHQASTVEEATRTVLLGHADEALTEALRLSDNKAKPDSLTLALFYEMKGEPERAAKELESYLSKAPQAKNADALKNEIKRLRQKAQDAARP